MFRGLIDLYYQDISTVLKAGNPPSPLCFFHSRSEGTKDFRDGEIVCLDNDCMLCKVGDFPIFNKSYLVVSDESQKKLGYSIPSQGHWCATLGLVRIRIDGTVAIGDLIGPNEDGSCSGMVAVNLTKTPIIGFALEPKGPSDKGNVLVFLSQNPYISKDLSNTSEQSVKDLEQIIREQIYNTMNILEQFSSFLNPGYEVMCRT